MSELSTEVMPQLCMDCGFQKTTTQVDFFETHIKLHFELDEILDALGIEQERPQYRISFAEGQEQG